VNLLKLTGLQRKWNLNNGDIEAVKEVLSGKFSSIAGVKFAPDNPRTAFYGDRQVRFQVAGVTSSYYTAMPHKIVQGRYVNDIDIKEERKVCVIGQMVADQLFPDNDIINKTILVDNVPYIVIGVCRNPNRQVSIGLDPEKSILLPMTTMQLSYNVPDKVDRCVIILKDRYQAENHTALISDVIRKRNHISPDDPTALQVVALSTKLKQFYNLFKALDGLIWIIGVGTLLAGLIGISNIMMVTINERTQEIGVRRALGAMPEDIIKQIMCESLVLTFASGILGQICGVWFLNALQSVLLNGEGAMFRNPHMPFVPALVCFLILIAGGLVAGWIPAGRALKIKAVEALREE